MYILIFQINTFIWLVCIHECCYVGTWDTETYIKIHYTSGSIVMVATVRSLGTIYWPVYMVSTTSSYYHILYIRLGIARLSCILMVLENLFWLGFYLCMYKWNASRLYELNKCRGKQISMHTLVKSWFPCNLMQIHMYVCVSTVATLSMVIVIKGWGNCIPPCC